MTYPYKLILAVCFVCWFVASHAAIPIDTVRKKIPIAGYTQVDPFADYMIYLKEAINNIQQDSLDKGIHQLKLSLNRVAATQSLTRVLDYHGLELFDMLGIIDTGKLTATEKQYGQAFVKTAFTMKSEKDAEAFYKTLKKMPYTAFTRRLKVMINGTKDIDDLNRLLKEQPNLVSANIYKAEISYDQDNYTDAIEWSSKAIELWPEYTHAYHVRAKSYQQNSEYKKAVADFDKALSLSPKFVLLDYDRADALLDDNQYQNAIAGYLKIYALSPDFKWTNYNLARCYKGIDMADSAMYYIEQHIKSHPDDGDGYDIKGDIYSAKDDYKMAIAQHSMAISLDKGKGAFYEDRGDDYFFSSQWDDAIKDYEQALVLRKDRAYPTNRLGECYYQKQLYDKAIAYHQMALKLSPNYKYTYVDLYYCYSKIGKVKEAINACQKAIAIDSTYSSAYGNMGWAYYLDDNFDACIASSYKAIQYNKSAMYAMFNICLATLRKGSFEEAKALYQKSFNLCKKNGYEINKGASGDLRDLIKRNIAVEEATYIIKKIFNEQL